MRPLDQYLESKYFEEYYNKCFEKINNFNSDIDKNINEYIKDQNYEDILPILQQLEKMNEPVSQLNIEKIQKLVKSKCRELCNSI